MPDELRRIGAQMANVMYNLVQKPGAQITPEWVKVMDDLRKQWDAAASASQTKRSGAPQRVDAHSQRLLEAAASGATLNSITHTAMRQHQCAGCGLTVHSGERYVRAQVPGGGLLAKRAFHIKCYTGLVAGLKRG